MKLKNIRIFCVLSLLLLSSRMFSQNEPVILDYYDTSNYIPSFYKGALDYNLMIAASQGYSLEIERLIKNGADANAISDYFGTPKINKQILIYNALQECPGKVRKTGSTDRGGD